MTQNSKDKIPRCFRQIYFFYQKIKKTKGKKNCFYTKKKAFVSSFTQKMSFKFNWGRTNKSEKISEQFLRNILFDRKIEKINENKVVRFFLQKVKNYFLYLLRNRAVLRTIFFLWKNPKNRWKKMFDFFLLKKHSFYFFTSISLKMSLKLF